MNENAITVDEWISEITRLDSEGESGFSFYEMKSILKVGNHSVRRRIRQLISEGKLKVGHKRYQDVSGRIQKITSYIPIVKRDKNDTAKSSRHPAGVRS